VPYPDKLLAADEEVVRHLHPHWLTLFWPVVRLLLLVGAASFGAAVVPAGPEQGLLRMVVLGLAVVLLLPAVLVPLLRWRTTHYVITTHRLLFRTGILARRGRDLGLSRITDVSYRQTLWERIIKSGTISIESAAESGPTVLRRIPDSDGVQHLLNHMIEEDADRRARENAEYLGEHYATGPGATDPGGASSWGSGSWGCGSWDSGSEDSGSEDSGSWGSGWGSGAWGTGPAGTRTHPHH
jgi:membrane protein YdbS with pleckstrin-like domain